MKKPKCSSIRSENRSILDLLTANYTFVNEPVAKLYGIPNIYGPRMRRIELPADSPRTGILGHGSILMLTSHSNITSPVLRGKWVLDNILGTPPSPPLPVVPDLKPVGADGGFFAIREQMVQHRSNAMCAGCHAQLDPIGLSLENSAIATKRRLDEYMEAIRDVERRSQVSENSRNPIALRDFRRVADTSKNREMIWI